MRIIELENKEKRVGILMLQNTIKVIDLSSPQKALHIPAFCYKRLPISGGSSVRNAPLH